MAGAALILSLLVSLPFLFVLARRPILRRLALRNAMRRPREALLVIVGSMLGAAIITGSFVVGDSMNGSIRLIAKSHLGPIDELAIAPDASSWHQLAHRLRALPRNEVDGVLPIETIDAAVTALSGNTIVAAPRAQVIGIDFTAARSFGGNARETGISGPTPRRGRAAIGADLARTLSVKPGDAIDIHAYNTVTTLIVDRVFPRRGVAGFWLGYERDARNVLVSPATFDVIRAWALVRAAPPRWAVAVSNRGGVESGVKRTDAVKAEILRAAGGIDPQVMPVKRTALDSADATGKSFTQMFTSMGSFGVIAGLLLLVNLFVMLAAERKPELGMARAVGMRRSWLVGAFASEGWLYALVATAFGTFVGLGLGRVLVALSQRAFNTKHNRFDLIFVVRPPSLAEAFAIAFLIALLTIVATSVRVSRLNIIRAIREIPEPPARRRRRWVVIGTGVSVLGLLWTGTALAGKDPYGLLLGPTLLLLGLAPVLGLLGSVRTVASLLASVVIAWGAVVLVLFPSATKGASVMLYVVQGIVLTSAAVVLAAFQQERLGGLSRRFAARALAFRLGLAYPLARRSRTGLTVAMYALVVFVLTWITTISHLIDADSAHAKASVRGGYGVVAMSSPANPIPLDQLSSMQGIRGVAPLAPTTANFTVEGTHATALWSLTGFGNSFLRYGPPKLEERGSYPTDAAAWRAVLHDPRLVIVDPAFLQTSGGPPNFKAKIGTKLTVQETTTGRTRELTVAAISPSDFYISNGAFYGMSGARSLFGSRLVPSRFYLALRPGVSATAMASAVQARFLENGTEALSIAALMDEAYAMSHQIFQLFEGYLAMGLLVGIAGIAVVMIRAVRERRRPIGSLRAIGFPSKTIGRSFAIEAGFIALEGTVIGASLALLTLYTLVTRSDAMGNLPFSVPWTSLALLLLGTVAASLLATVAPALAATRIRPAVALRLTD